MTASCAVAAESACGCIGRRVARDEPDLVLVTDRTRHSAFPKPSVGQTWQPASILKTGRNVSQSYGPVSVALFIARERILGNCRQTDERYRFSDLLSQGDHVIVLAPAAAEALDGNGSRVLPRLDIRKAEICAASPRLLLSAQQTKSSPV